MNNLDPEPAHVASTRAVYDHSAPAFVDAVGTEVSPRFEAPMDRAILSAFAEEVASMASGQVLDIGCGPGRIAAFLAQRGLDIRGVDIAPGMVAAARAAHPHLRFDVGELTDLPAADGSLVAAVAWYSIIATPLSELAAVWAELDRVLTDDGRVLIAFQSGDNDRVETPDTYGSMAALTLHRHRVEDVSASLNAAGFDVLTELRRRPALPHETAAQAFLVARRR